MENYETLKLISLGMLIGFGLAAWLIADVVNKVLNTSIVQKFLSDLVQKVRQDKNWEFKKVKLYGYDATLKANSEGLFLCLRAIKWKIYP